MNEGKVKGFQGMARFVRMKMTIRSLHLNAKLRCHTRSRNRVLARSILKTLLHHSRTQRILHQKHKMILTYFERKRRVSGAVRACFEMLHLHSLKRRKQRGIEALNFEKARGFWEVYGSIRLKKACFEVLRNISLEARAYKYNEYLSKRRVLLAIRKSQEMDR